DRGRSLGVLARVGVALVGLRLGRNAADLDTEQVDKPIAIGRRVAARILAREDRAVALRPIKTAQLKRHAAFLSKLLRECRSAEQWLSSLLDEGCARAPVDKFGNSASAFGQRLARTRDWARINVPTKIWTAVARARAGSCACKWSFRAENSSLFCWADRDQVTAGAPRV